MPNAELPFFFIVADVKYQENVEPNILERVFGDKTNENLKGKFLWQ